MHMVIWYFSGTGNTALVARELADRCTARGWAVHCLDILQGIPDGLDPSSVDLWGFGFPVYKLTWPRIMDTFVRGLAQKMPVIPGAPPRKAFLFATFCRFRGSSLGDAGRGLCEAGFPVLWSDSFKCPSNGACSLLGPGVPLYDEVMFFEPAIHLHLDAFAARVTAGPNAPLPRKPPRERPVDRLRIRVAGSVEHAGYPWLSVDEGLCIRCGLCARSCPEGNLVQESGMSREGGRFPLQVRDPVDCLHCLRCLHLCPRQAIGFATRRTGPSRYTPRVRDALFAQATARTDPGGPMVPARARYLWALGNILWWIFGPRGKHGGGGTTAGPSRPS